LRLHRALPAKKQAAFLVRERAIADGTLRTRYARCGGPRDHPSHASLCEGGRSRLLVTWGRRQQNAALRKVAERARDAGAFRRSACYCSIFGRRWVVSNGSDAPAAVSSCAADRPKASGRLL
jgi:hypothetical protein